MKKTLRLIVSLLVLTLFCWVLVSWIDWPRFLSMVCSVQLGWLGLAFLSYTCVYAARAIRMQVLIPQTTFMQMFGINSLQYFFNKLLPARTGELTLPVLIQRYTKASFKRGLATLLLLRYMDVLIIMVLLLVSLFIVQEPAIIVWRAYSWLLVLAVLLMLTILGCLPLLAQRFKKLQKFIPAANYFWFILNGLRDTALAWICLYGYFYFITLSLGLSFSFWAVVFACTFTVLTIVLPVSAVGNFGTFEAGWVIGFVLLGMAKADALAVGFFTNIVLTLINGLLALVSFMYLEGKKQNS